MEIYNEKFKKGVVYNVFDLPLPQVFISKYFSSIEINADTLEPIKEDEEAKIDNEAALCIKSFNLKIIINENKV